METLNFSLNPFQSKTNRTLHHIHLIGIGGVGMCGLAEILHNAGYRVSGSDLISSINTTYLKKIGVTVYLDHQASNIQSAELIVFSSAIH